MKSNNVSRMKELIAGIREADLAYFQNDSPIMTDREYDALMEELQNLEETTGISFSNSPLKKVAGEISRALKQVRHTKPMRSIKKTKNILDVKEFSKEREIILSWKLDGLTLVLRYENGLFKQAITRGRDGIVGEDVTHTVRLFRNVPEKISCKRDLEVRGEGVISWKDFELLTKNDLNQTHPRNLAAGTVRTVKADWGKCSHLDFFAFESIQDDENHVTKEEQLDYLSGLGFSVVPHKVLSKYHEDASLNFVIREFDPETFDYPADGLVVEYNDLAYGRTLGATRHHDNNKIALKWEDTLYPTVFRGVELVTTRTGLVSLVAIFDPVMIEGTTVKRASIHNLSAFEGLRLGIGDTLSVYKANMIIPQIAENLTQSGTFVLPAKCPSCGEELTVKYSSGGIKNLYCLNEGCISRNAQKIARLCDKEALNIKGISAVTLETLMTFGWVRNYRDLYHLEDYRDEIAGAQGFGIAKYNEMKEAIEASRKSSLDRFLVGISIPLMGPQAAKIIAQYFYGSWDQFEEAIRKHFSFSHIEGISSALEQSIYKWYEDKNEEKLWRPLLTELSFGKRPSFDPARDTGFYDVNVVVTGTISGMTREQITEVLTLMGAVVSNTVSKKTDILIVGSMPGGNKLGKAMELGTKIITESEFAKTLQAIS